MSKKVTIQVEPEDLHFPDGVNQRLLQLLDKQDTGQQLSASERQEAEGLVELAELVSLLNLRAQGAAQNDSAPSP